MWENEEVVPYAKGDYVYVNHHCGYRTRHTVGRVVRVTPKGSISVVALEEDVISERNTASDSSRTYKIRFDPSTDKPIDKGDPVMYRSLKGSAPKHGDSDVTGVAKLETMRTQTFTYNCYY
jgi:hypothetical protein